MTKWIRWSGLAGFVALTAFLAGFWLFALGPIIKFSIESFASKAVGAQVNVAEVSMGFDPLAITITDVQVADKDAPMTNLVSFDSAVANIEFFPLLLGKAIVPELSLAGVAFASARSESGALPNKVRDKAEAQSDASPEQQDNQEADSQTLSSANDVPSVDDILAREPLLTTERGEDFKQAYDEHKDAIDTALADLPDEQAFKQYEKQLQQIVKGKFKSADDFKQRKKELDALQAQFKADQKAIKHAQTLIKNSKKDLGAKWKLLKKAPQQDYANLKGKYTLDGAGAANLTALLFGDDAGGYSETLLSYYEKLRPLLVDDEQSKAEQAKQAQEQQRLKGQFVHFATDRPQPDFWIQQLRFTASLPGQPSLGQIKVNIKDITHQQDVINKPTVLLATGQNLSTMDSLVINGVLDHRQGRGIDRLNYRLQGWQVEGMELGLAGLQLQDSRVFANGEAQLIQGKLNSEHHALFKQAQFITDDNTTFAKEMLAALQGIDRFDVNARVSGSLTDPSFKVRSDLDSQLKKAFDKRLAQKQAQLEQELKEKLNEQLLSYAGDYQSQIKALDVSNGQLKDKGKALNKLAKSELSSYEDQLKAEVQAKAKAKADQKKKELERKAKEKLKSLF